jgi:hypothetical protein
MSHDVILHDITGEGIIILTEEEGIIVLTQEESRLSRQNLKKILCLLCRYESYFRIEENAAQEHGGGREHNITGVRDVEEDVSHTR